MARVQPWYPGVPRTFSVRGFGITELGLNGEYDLEDSAEAGGQRPRWKRRAETMLGISIPASWISFSYSDQRWTLRSTNGQLFAMSSHNNPTPDGPWEDGFSVSVAYETPSPLAMLAFPRPKQSLQFYSGRADSFLGKQPQALLARSDLVFLETSRGEQIPSIHKRVPGSRFTLLYSHGNAEDLGLSLDYIDVFSQLTQCSILAYEYVGYSLSYLEGLAPSEDGCYRSAEAAWRYLTLDLGLRAGDIVLFGRSIGSGPAVHLAFGPAKHCAGVALQGPIASAGRCALGLDSSIRWLAQAMDMFVNIDKVGDIDRPVAIMHGTKDTVVPIVNGEELHGMLQQPFDPLWLDGYGHNNMPIRECAAYVRRFLEMLQQHMPMRQLWPGIPGGFFNARAMPPAKGTLRSCC